MRKEYRLPRDPLDLRELSDLIPLPPEVRETIDSRLPLIPDHIEEARKECTYQFLERSLLPRMAEDTPCTREELINLAQAFKDDFQQQYPNDLDPEFKLLFAAKFHLGLLDTYFSYQVEPEFEEVGLRVRQAADTFKTVLTTSDLSTL